MKVKLNILERVVLMTLFPQKGDIRTCRAVSNTAKIIMITPEEEQEVELKREDGRTTWNDKGKEEKEFSIPSSSIAVIRDILDKLDEDQNLPVNAISLCEKFLPGEKDPDQDLA
jgi:hypothetical protein